MVFSFPTSVGPQAIYMRKDIVLILANKEGGAHVDQHDDPNYVRLLTNEKLKFSFEGAEVETPDLARFLTAQSGVEMLECIKRNFFPDYEMPSKWEYGVAPPIARYMDSIALIGQRVIRPFPTGELRVTRRD